MRRARAALVVLAIAVAASACSSCKKVWPGPGASDDPPARPKTIPSSSVKGDLDSKPPEKPGAHPRMLLTSDRLKAIAALKAKNSPIWERLHDECEEMSSEAKPSGYEGWDWANGSLSLAICYRVTGEKKYAAMAVKYFVALLDDKEKVGDGKGGDHAAEHDDGYAIRTHGAMATIAYDWLDGFPDMTPAIKKHAMDRFIVWTKWFEQKGWNHDEPISNYYVSWFATAAFGALAAAGEDDRAAELRALAAKLWNKEIVPVYSTKIAGGDFPEGWQYGDNVMAFLALYCDAERTAGSGKRLEAELPWLREAIAYRAHALTPDGVHMYDTGDWQEHPPRAPLHGIEAVAMLLGDADADGKRAQALAALARTAIGEQEEWRWFAALTADAAKPSDEIRKGATSYLARGTATMIARTDWSPNAVWVAFSSAPSLSDHQHLDAGHFEIVRGADWLVIDSGDYSAYSSMSHNTILVDDKNEIMAYAPNQGTWSDTAKIARFADDGKIAYAMADYASAYNGIHSQEDGKRPVTRAERELVFLRGDGPIAKVIVYDRMTVKKASYPTTFLLHGGTIPTISGNVAKIRVGKSAAFATTLLPAGAPPHLVKEPTPPRKDRPFYNNEPPEGVKSMRIEVASPLAGSPTERRFLHAIVVGAAADAPPVAAELIAGEGAQGALVGDDAIVFVEAGPQPSPAPVAFKAAATARRIFVAGLAPSQSYGVTASKNGDVCAVALSPGGTAKSSDAGTIAVAIDGACAIAK